MIGSPSNLTHSEQAALTGRLFCAQISHPIRCVLGCFFSPLILELSKIRFIFKGSIMGLSSRPATAYVHRQYVSGYSYAHTGSIAFSRRVGCKTVPRQDLLAIVLELVHPGNLGQLPPSPSMIAYRGDQIGVGKYGEFFTEVWFEGTFEQCYEWIEENREQYPESSFGVESTRWDYVEDEDDLDDDER